MRTHPCDIYHELRTLYDHCNATFFGDTLPACMIVLRPRRNTFGYFQHACWGRPEDSEGAVDAIAINSERLRTKGEEEIVSTMVHEMTHLWQEHYGERKPPKPYHNREWAAKMVEHGLMPSNTGLPGGKQLGKHMSEYRLDNGLFRRWYDDLAKPLLSWAEFPKLVAAKQQPKKYKYVCPRCEAKAWAHEGTALACGDCREPMVTEAVQVPLLGNERPVPDMGGAQG